LPGSAACPAWQRIVYPSRRRFALGGFSRPMKDQSIEACSGEERTDPPSEPSTTMVVGLLLLAALTLSYLGAYAVAGALMDSDVLPHWSLGNDPRPRWMACLFGVLLAASLLVSAVARLLSRRQLRRIDAMAEEQ
jgi:hypothetical protein